MCADLNIKDVKLILTSPFAAISELQQTDNKTSSHLPSRKNHLLQTQK